VFYDIGSAFRAAADFSNETLMGNAIGENVEANRPVLTVAQQRVYEAFLQGLSEKEVAAQLGVSVHSVHNHTKSIYRGVQRQCESPTAGASSDRHRLLGHRGWSGGVAVETKQPALGAGCSCVGPAFPAFGAWMKRNV